MTFDRCCVGVEHVTDLVLHPAMVYDGEGSVLADFFADARAGRPIRLVGKEGLRWPVVQQEDGSWQFNSKLQA